VTSSTWTRRSWVTNNHDASGKMIELKFFGEQTITQMAEQLGCAKATIEIPARPVATAAKPPNRATEIGDLCHQIESTRPSVLTLLRFLLSARGLTDLCDSCSRRVGRLHRGVPRRRGLPRRAQRSRRRHMFRHDVECLKYAVSCNDL
jgi:hypothetical protein